MESTPLLEEPISPELVLVDRELAVRAREASPDPSWLLPVLAELQQREQAQPAAAVEERSAADVLRRQPPSPLWKHLRAIGLFGCLAIGLVALAALVLDLVPTSKGPTLGTGRAEPTASPTPTQSRGHRRAPHVTTRPRAAVKPNVTPKRKTTPGKRATRPAASTSAPKKALEPKQAAKPKARAVAKVQRVFSWHRAAAAVYYQFYLQRGAATIYQTRTVKLTAALPAHLKLRPGTYHALVRPAIPSDAGIVLGNAILEKTIRV